MKIAVVLLNLGGPDKKESIRPFLRNFFMDGAIIPAPRPFRDLISWLIARKRSRAEAGDSYAALGDKSPLLENTQAQADALQAQLGDGFKVFVCMRYWHPMAPEVVEQVKAYNPDKIVLLPLYPQLSTTTTESSVKDWMAAAEKGCLGTETRLICCYPAGDGFIKASADNIRTVYDEMLSSSPRHSRACPENLDPRNESEGDDIKKPRLLFSAHGVPLFVLKRGDPYIWQCSASAKAIVKELNIDGLDWAECYQSRVGPVKWTEPSVEQELERAAKEGVPVIIYPHAFVSEHVETLVEIEEEYRHMAHELGVTGFARVPTVSTHPAFIGFLKDQVHEALQPAPNHTPAQAGVHGSLLSQGCEKKSGGCRSEITGVYGGGKNGQGLCPPEFKACACRFLQVK